MLARILTLAMMGAVISSQGLTGQQPTGPRAATPQQEAPYEPPDAEAVWPEGEWAFGGSLGLPGVGMAPFPAAFTLGGHAQYFPSRGVGVEGSLGVAPLGLAFGGLVAGARAGLVAPLRTGSLLVLPSAGVSGLAGASRNGVEPGTAMVYAGLATLSAEGLRVGVTVHWVEQAERPVWLVELGGIRLPDRGLTRD